MTRATSITLLAALALSSPALSQGQLYSVPTTPQFPGAATAFDALGDLDEDGTPDWIAGNPQGARVLSGANGSVIYSYPATLVGSSFGTTVLGLEDIDDDGTSDFLVAGPSADGDFARSGVAYVFSGRSGAVIRTHSGGEVNAGFGVTAAALGGPAGTQTGTLTGGFYALGEQGTGRIRVFAAGSGAEVYALDAPQPFSTFGSTMANAGDHNQDGYDDVLVGFGVSPARVQVFAGGTFQSTHPMLFEVTDEAFQNPFGGFTNFGRSLDTLGDVNGDGVPDYAVGAMFEVVPGASSEGRVRAFDGATGAVLWAASGASARFASSVATSTDHDGDGVRDVLVGGPGYIGSLAPGGQPGRPPLGSVSLLSGATGQRLALFRGAFDYDRFGDSIGSIGDTNGDGLGEIVVSSFGGFVQDTRVYSGSLSPQPRGYCASLPHSQTQPGSMEGAHLDFTGSAQLSANDLVLWTDRATIEQAGAFFAGTAAAQVTVGDGILCLGGPRRLLAVRSTNSWGFAWLSLRDLPIGSFTAGETIFVQYAFRDPGSASGSGVNFSDGLAVTFWP